MYKDERDIINEINSMLDNGDKPTASNHRRASVARRRLAGKDDRFNIVGSRTGGLTVEEKRELKLRKAVSDIKGLLDND
jgi:hypothetical protein